MVEAVGDTSKKADANEEGTGADAGPKHAALVDERDDGVALIQNKFIRNLTSPFINHKKSWDEADEFATISAEMQKGIVEELGFLKPSRIQGLAIPMISQPITKDSKNVLPELIAQSKI